MKQELKKYTVYILNEPYTLVGDESEDNVIEAAKKVDLLIQEVASKAPHCNNYQKAVLAALKIALQLIALESKQEETMQMVKKCLDAFEEPMLF